MSWGKCALMLVLMKYHWGYLSVTGWMNQSRWVASVPAGGARLALETCLG